MQEVSRNLTLIWKSETFWKSETLTQIHQTRPVSHSIQPDNQSQRSSIILTTDLAQLVHLSQSVNPSGPTSPFNLQSVISLSFHQICPSFLPEGSSTSITRTTLPHRKWMIHSGKQLPEFQWKMISLSMKQSFPNHRPMIRKGATRHRYFFLIIVFRKIHEKTITIRKQYSSDNNNENAGKTKSKK